MTLVPRESAYEYFGFCGRQKFCFAKMWFEMIFLRFSGSQKYIMSDASFPFACFIIFLN